MATKCAGYTKAGKPCQGTPLPGGTLCFVHDPAMAERRQQGSIKGGRGKSAKVRAQRQLRDSVMAPADVSGLLSISMQKVATGVMEPGVGTALASMAKALMSVQETAQLADRLAALERAAGIEADNVTSFPDRRTS
jgi:hypothetical protein